MKPRRTIFSLFPDASLCQQTGVGGWGFWVKLRGVSHIGGGIFRSTTRSSGESISYRHIKGHVENGERRHFVNNIADKIANHNMRRARHALASTRRNRRIRKPTAQKHNNGEAQ